MPDIERKQEYIISDRRDIQVEIATVEFDDIANRTPAEPSREIRKRVMAATSTMDKRRKDGMGRLLF